MWSIFYRYFSSINEARQALDQAILAFDPCLSYTLELKMHEMSLAEGVLQLVTDTARREAAMRVQTVVLEIGQLSAVEPEALKFCFDVVAHGSIAQGAVLEIVVVPGTGWCMPCAETVAMEARYGACPKCGSYEVQTTGGSEMRVKEIEIE